MHGLAKGLIENGHSVHFLVISPGHDLLSTNERNGTYDKVDFTYICNYTKKPTNLIKKIYILIISILSSIKTTIILHRKYSIDVMIFGTNVWYRVIPLFILSRISKIKMIREYNEYPETELGHKKKIPYFSEFSYKVEFNLFDGMVVISRPLREFFGKILFRNKKICIIPIIVDPGRFQENRYEMSTAKNIVFIGDILGEKDGVKILLQAFELIHNVIPEYHLTLIGDISNTIAYLEFKMKYINASIARKVNFTGFIHRDKINDFLSKASILVLPRPATKQSEGGLPTKLGEYLASGKPVVCTKVGDIPYYLHDGINAFLAEPGDANHFAQKMLFCLRNYELAKQVGSNGKLLVFSEFNYKTQSKVLADFLMDL